MNPVIRTSKRTRKNITRYEEDPETYATTLYSLQRQRQFNQRKKKALMKAFAAEVIAPVQEFNPRPGEDPTAYFPPPKNIQQTMGIRDKNKRRAWISATRKELKQLIDSGTFDKDEKIRPGEPVIPITETNKVKLNRAGNLDKLKVRMCVRGDIQKKLTPDMEDTYSPAAAFRFLKLFLAHAASKKAKVHQGDVIGAFLQANMRSRVFVTLNKYYGLIFPEFQQFCGKPLLLKKAMYGMTLSGKYWYQDCRDWLISVGFMECPTCLVLFNRKDKDGSELWIIIYIDDFLYFGTTEKTRKQFEAQFGTRFNIEFQGLAHWYLASRISQDKDFNITLDQSRYSKSIVKRYLMPAGIKKIDRAVNTILPSDFVPTKNDCAETVELSKEMQKEYNIDYPSCIRSLIFLSNTRPDMTFGINKLAKFMVKPGEKHMLALVHLLKYLSYHTELGITFYSDIKKSPVYQMLEQNNITPSRNMFTFSDSSWDDDYDTSRSTGGYVYHVSRWTLKQYACTSFHEQCRILLQ